MPAHGAEYGAVRQDPLQKQEPSEWIGPRIFAAAKGGTMVTNDEESPDQARQLHIFGEQPAGHEEETRAYTVDSAGCQYPAQELPAALGGCQSMRLDEIGRNITSRCRI